MSNALSEFSLDENRIFYGRDSLLRLDKFLKEGFYSKIFVLVDNNTHKYCLPHLLSNITLSDHNLIKIPFGEENKTIETCIYIWQKMTELGADRKSLVINLGGGVLTDMGSFACSCFKRGVRFVNIPTNLLSMVDACFGGKTGIDFRGLKNHIGLFSHPVKVAIDVTFLESLSAKQLRSGFSEVIKHALIYDEKMWEEIRSIRHISPKNIEKFIPKSIDIKSCIVRVDPREKGPRKALNFGHTIGHAIESLYLNDPNKKTLLHGEAIAIGMIAEAYISHIKLGLPICSVQEIEEYIFSVHELVYIDKFDFSSVIELIKYDKKNELGTNSFSLLCQIGKCQTDISVEADIISQSLLYYNRKRSSI
ncbi:3-dehydroquinate synthase [Ichthyobacterium seriolicida]|uniref:3-dehydroquinate synthase n=1 Tax=Ichthyobacterium seriolicida TaxID=242600 RepID=A0A1J1DWR4_9FLAO|nr:3-dehydroquinate synthase family protein [Ichthyobacterium seriolicida]BAV94298.1 3-dehydroquinate synthase [Ichthyobacterium seriolicida]